MSDRNVEPEITGIDPHEAERQIRRLGFRRRVAYVSTKLSAGAARTNKHRLGQHARGLKQINVVIPADDASREAIKSIAARLAREPSAAEDILRVVSGISNRGYRIPLFLAAFGAGLMLGLFVSRLF